MRGRLLLTDTGLRYAFSTPRHAMMSSETVKCIHCILEGRPILKQNLKKNHFISGYVHLRSLERQTTLSVVMSYDELKYLPLALLFN